MLVAVPQINHAFAHVNALFLQPTPWCARHCNNCYVKGFEQKNGNEVSPVFTEILDLVNQPEVSNPKRLLANQITLALDKRPLKPVNIRMDGSHSSIFFKRELMLRYFEKFLIAKSKSIGGEFHVTVHTINDLFDYWQSQTNRIMIDMVSLSTIDSKEISCFQDIRSIIAPHINWNLTADPSLKLDKENFYQIAEAVDSIYLVLHKPSTGQHLDIHAFERYQELLQLIKIQPESIQNKVHIDGCLSDSRKFLSTGYGCSSNVSRFQVWPDGSVSGCAYNQERVTPAANNLSELLKNLTQASKVYEFNKCKIPHYLNPNNQHVQNRTNHYLEIIQ